MDRTRYQETETYIWDLAERFLVQCPKCHSMAQVGRLPGTDEADVCLTCVQCGHNKLWKCTNPGIYYGNNQHTFPAGTVSIGAAVDWYFHLPLWLQAPCCGHTLWAYNYRHLSWVKSYVEADLRENYRSPKWGWSNQRLASRLPRWMKLATNREAVLRTIEVIAEGAV